MTIPDFGPVLGRTGRPLDQIRLLGVTARGRHGVLEHERQDGQEFSVDAVLHLDTSTAAATDDLAATVDYGALATRIADLVRGEPVDLIETLAARIAASCLESPGVVAVDVAVHKPQAPISEQFDDVVVAIRREKLSAHKPQAPISEQFDDVVVAIRREKLSDLDRRPAEPVTAVLALGTNLGDRAGILRAAVAELGQLDDVQVVAVSPAVETAPVGGPEQPDYLNAVVLLTTRLSPNALLAAGQRIEAGHGRERSIRWGPRTLDIDVIRYGDLLSDDPVLELPHPRAARRAFVLAPWLAVDPQAWLPGYGGRQPVAPLLLKAPDRDGVRERPDLGLLP
jgi:dihydroneopterin aldolase / 2-amino-4-hydroxy-6-hydroxymethyldihydropteridine diphosphokinase